MNILAVEPFYAGSHRSWLDSLKKHSSHNISLLTLPGRHWKWRMYGGAVSLAKEFNKLDFKPDLLLATDMLDLTTFLALSREKTANIPVAIYFHENQFSYPWSERDPDIQYDRDKQYGFINYTSALAADKCFFNSEYHLKSFIEEIGRFAKLVPDKFPKKTIKEIFKKSEVLYLGLELNRFRAEAVEKINDKPKILWNHRWEYDKNPEDFFTALKRVREAGHEFELILLGEHYQQIPVEFEQAKEVFKKEIIHLGYVENFEDYKKLLWQSDILPVTSIQDFFGISIAEAIYCNTYPILPNRLAYPELIPESEKKLLYNDQEELFAKLANAIINYKSFNNQGLINFINKFDWQEQIYSYDSKFENLVMNYC